MIKGGIMNTEGIIKELEKLEARSMWKMLPAYKWKDKKYSQIYDWRARETETLWHDAIKSLQLKIQEEVI